MIYLKYIFLLKMSKKKNNFIEFKIITLGNAGVGKTSILRRFLSNTFEDNSLSTIGMEFSSKKINLKDNSQISLRLLDTSGQERYQSLALNYFKNANGVLFVFALNNVESFKNLNKWIQLFKDNSKSNIPKYLVGTKSDLSTEIDQNEIEDFSKTTNMKYYQISSKENKNINELFEDIGEKLYSTYINSTASKGIQLKTKEVKKKKKNSCCEMTVSNDL